MYRKMEPVEVSDTEGYVVIKQEFVAAKESKSIYICPEQVDLLIEWLRSAKIDAMDNRRKKEG